MRRVNLEEMIDFEEQQSRYVCWNCHWHLTYHVQVKVKDNPLLFKMACPLMKFGIILAGDTYYEGA